MSAIEHWYKMVAEEHAQSERVRGDVPPPNDFWETCAYGFISDPYRTDDSLLEGLRRHVLPDHSIIDVGAGAGRYALPLALSCNRVEAVEPSASMAFLLRLEAKKHGANNLYVLESTWQQARVEPADIVVCVHVPYVVRDIAHFVRKLCVHSRQQVIVVMYQVPAQAYTFPLWPGVHGEKRMSLPAMPQFIQVLQEMGIEYELEKLPPHAPRSFNSFEEALEQLAQRLFLSPDSPKRKLLQQALDEFLEECDGAYHIRGAPMLEPTLVIWVGGAL